MKDDNWFQKQDRVDEYSSSLHQRTEELYLVPEAEPGDDGLITLPGMILRDIVVFPHMVSPMFVTPGENLLAIQEAQFHYETVVALVMRDPEMEEVETSDLLPIGVEVAVGRLLNMPDGNSSALVQGRRRVEIIEYLQEEPFYRVKVRVLEEPEEV